MKFFQKKMFLWPWPELKLNIVTWIDITWNWKLGIEQFSGWVKPTLSYYLKQRFKPERVVERGPGEISLLTNIKEVFGLFLYQGVGHDNTLMYSMISCKNFWLLSASKPECNFGHWSKMTLNRQHFWKWTNVSPMKIIGRAAIASKL